MLVDDCVVNHVRNRAGVVVVGTLLPYYWSGVSLRDRHPSSHYVRLFCSDQSARRTTLSILDAASLNNKYKRMKYTIFLLIASYSDRWMIQTQPPTKTCRTQKQSFSSSQHITLMCLQQTDESLTLHWHSMQSHHHMNANSSSLRQQSSLVKSLEKKQSSNFHSDMKSHD